MKNLYSNDPIQKYIYCTLDNNKSNTISVKRSVHLIFILFIWSKFCVYQFQFTLTKVETVVDNLYKFCCKIEHTIVIEDQHSIQHLTHFVLST